jgi:hypothetical protein
MRGRYTKTWCKVEYQISQGVFKVIEGQWNGHQTLFKQDLEIIGEKLIPPSNMALWTCSAFRFSYRHASQPSGNAIGEIAKAKYLQIPHRR